MALETTTCDLLAGIRRSAPLVHNITNHVVMNSTANILLALGASPVMAHSRREVAEMATLAGALVLNIGTLSQAWRDAMLLAARAANAKGIPVVLDPVGAGATAYRTETARRILGEADIAVIRGNASEILALTDATVQTRGVDSSMDLCDASAAAANALAREHGCVVGVSGARDLITDGAASFRVANGVPLMTRVTGLGCGLSAVVGAFCAEAPGSGRLAAVAAAFGYYGVCAEMAHTVSDRPGSFFVAFLDALYSAGNDDLRGRLQIDRQTAT